MRRPAASVVLKRLSPLRDFLHTEAAGGILLALGATVALIWANSPWSDSYASFWSSEISIGVAGHALEMDLRHWLNDGLMTIFFFVVGLEIKRELTEGHLSSRRTATLPIVAALGGMVVPALAYVVVAGRTASDGWAVPMATDIALALGVVSLAGRAVPSTQRAFLLGLAIVDDIGAIAVIAVFYSSGVSVGWLLLAAGALVATVVARRAGLRVTWPYVVLGAAAWFGMHEGGIHATLAGVAMGLLAPVTPHTPPDLVDVEELLDLSSIEHVRASAQIARTSVSVVDWLEHVLHPWTSYVIVPLFAVANAGIEISVDGLRDSLGSAITWGVVAGLVLGKPLGVGLARWLAVRTGIATPPVGATRRTNLGVGAAAGIGFTVSLFIAELAFDDEVQLQEAKLAILMASIIAAVASLLVLRGAPSPQDATSADDAPALDQVSSA